MQRAGAVRGRRSRAPAPANRPTRTSRVTGVRTTDPREKIEVTADRAWGAIVAPRCDASRMLTETRNRCIPCPLRRGDEHPAATNQLPHI